MKEVRNLQLFTSYKLDYVIKMNRTFYSDRFVRTSIFEQVGNAISQFSYKHQ
jgi:hypothetical protein